MFKTSQNVNLLFFEFNNINAKEYYKHQNELNKKNNTKITKPSSVSDAQKNSTQNMLSLSKESSNSFSFSEIEENENQNENENKCQNCDEFIFPLPNFDIFDYSKVIEISSPDDDDDEVLYKKKESNNVDLDDKSTGPTDQNQNKIELIKKAKIDKYKGKRNYNNRTQNRKSPSSKKIIRERSRNKV